MGLSEVILEASIYGVLAVASILVVFGSYRRRSNNAFLRFLIMVAFNASFTLITLIIGQMVSRPSENKLTYVIWAMFLVLFHGISDAISAFALEDNEQWSSSVLALFVPPFYVVGVLVSSHLSNSFLKKLIIVYFFAASFPIYKGYERIRALKKGSENGVAVDTKRVADLMSRDDRHELAHHNYVVTENGEWRKIDVAREKVITVGKVFNCQGRLLSAAGDPDSKMKDLCLSFSMYNLLCCHFAGYSFPKPARDRQLAFVRGALLLGDIGAGENYRRPFRLIEQELGFLYDRFYTKYASLFQKEAQVWKIFFFVIAAVFLLQPYLIPKEKRNVSGNGIRVTMIIIGVFTCLELLQILFFAVSNWGKVLLLCKYVGKPSWRSNELYERFVQVVCSFPSFKLWGRQLGQYCFLESFHKSSKWIYKVPLSNLFLEDPGKGHAGSSFVPLSPHVQRAVLAWIKQNGRRLTKGRASLIDNGVGNEELLLACEFEETTKVIMIWHIATSLCEIQHGYTSSTFEVSMALSKYCAYLVAFAPRLLPDHYVLTNDLFNTEVGAAGALLEACKSMEDKYREIMAHATVMHIHEGLHFPEEIARYIPEEMVFALDHFNMMTVAGGRVVKLLMEQVGDDAERLWKILADFWTEMVLFVAPCDDPRPHAEHLAQGGEFVTHLMALLFHAGVAKREFIEDAAIV